MEQLKGTIISSQLYYPSTHLYYPSTQLYYSQQLKNMTLAP